MDDLISRQAAIDVLCNGNCHEEGRSCDDGDCPVVREIKALPSAHPELCEDAVSRQRLLSDLKELVAAWKEYPVMAEQIKGVETAIGYVESIPSVKPNSKELSETHKALDTISRQVAIDALNESIKHFDVMAEECRRNANIERNDYMDMRDDAAEYRQLSIWLNELKWLRERFQSHPEIVRCKDCKWYELPSHKITENCVRWMKSNGILLPIKPNDYCGYAERRTDDSISD